MSLRKVLSADAQSLLELAESTFRAGFEHLNDPDDFEAYIVQAFSLEKTRQELNTQGSEFYFAMIESEAVGYIKLNYGAAQTDMADEPGIELQRIYVLPQQQGKGIGQYLLKQSIKMAKERGFPYLWLGVWEKNEGAIRFYRRHGFAHFSSHTFMLGNDPQTDLLMKLPFVE